MDFDPMVLRDGVIMVILFIVCISFHEWGHAIVADYLGDDTPHMEGRVTLNPLSHIDMIGTVVVPLVNLIVFRGAFNFLGWGRPVTTNPSNFRHRARDDVLVSLAGPAANLLLAVVVAVVGSFVAMAQPRLGVLAHDLIVMNVGLAVFNLLPLPPLDGGRILRQFVGMSEETFARISMWSGVFLLIVMNVPLLQLPIAVAVATVCRPFAFLCYMISPGAYAAIFLQ